MPIFQDSGESKVGRGATRFSKPEMPPTRADAPFSARLLAKSNDVDLDGADGAAGSVSTGVPDLFFVAVLRFDFSACESNSLKTTCAHSASSSLLY